MYRITNLHAVLKYLIVIPTDSYRFTVGNLMSDTQMSDIGFKKQSGANSAQIVVHEVAVEAHVADVDHASRIATIITRRTQPPKATATIGGCIRTHRSL